MGRAQQDETLWDAGKEGNVALRGFLTCAPHQATGVIKAQDGLGGKKQKSWAGRSKTGHCGMLTKRGESRCLAPLRALLHQVSVVITNISWLVRSPKIREGRAKAKHSARLRTQHIMGSMQP